MVYQVEHGLASSMYFVGGLIGSTLQAGAGAGAGAGAAVGALGRSTRLPLRTRRSLRPGPVAVRTRWLTGSAMSGRPASILSDQFDISGD